MKDFIGDLIDRHIHVYSKTEIRFKSWRASMNPLHFQELIELLTNSILFGVTSSTQTLVIVGQKFAGKTTLTKQILEYVPNLQIVDSYETIPDHFCIHLFHQFFNELIESDECSQLHYECLIEPLTEIIANESVLKQMRETDPLGFDDVYHTHFIEKKNTFRLVY